MSKIRRAILSCYDKTGLVELAQVLREFGVELISTSGTLHVLQENGIEAMSIADFTGVPELMDGRVKSLHHKVHAGLLGIRENKLHVEQMQAYDIQWIDMVVANFQPIPEVPSGLEGSVDEFFEQIDIGGAAMVRSAAKNFRYVTVAVNPSWYPRIIHELLALEGSVSFVTRYHLAEEAFFATAAYDYAIAQFLRTLRPKSGV